MMFLDSWVWLEFLFDGEKTDEAESVILRADTADGGGLITPTVLAEVSYRIRVVEDTETAETAVRAMQEYEYIESFPVVDEIGVYASELRHKYYDRDEQPLSYADAIHLATAVLHEDCHTLYTGDPDFDDIEEIETVVL